MNIILKGPLKHKLSVPAQDQLGLNIALVIQDAWVATWAPPYAAAAVNISEGVLVAIKHVWSVTYELYQCNQNVITIDELSLQYYCRLALIWLRLNSEKVKEY